MYKKTIITKETLFAIGWEDYSEPFEKDLGLQFYCSPDKRFVIQPDKNSNMGHAAWHLHIDNSDMYSIGAVSVEYIEQIQALMEIYKDY